MRKYSKILVIAFVFSLLVSIVGTVYAAGNIFTIKNVEAVEKSETVEVEKIEFNSEKINADVVYHKVGDYVKYKITIQNGKDEDYKLKAITDNNKNSYISYEYDDCTDVELKANGSADLYVTVKYLTAAGDATDRDQDIDVDFDIVIVDKNGNVVNGRISMSPQTGDTIMTYVTMFGISAVAFIFFFILKNKENRSKRIFILIMVMVLIAPVMVTAAANSSVTVKLKGTFSLKDKITITYTDASGNEKTKLADYGESTSMPEALEKEDYDFIGWYDENGEEVKELSNLTKDIKLTPKFKAKTYTITYNLGTGGETDNPETYTIESNTITLSDPTRNGYTFDGWTGDNGETPEKNVTIPKGSKGNKTYTANWTPIVYTITYILDDGIITGEPKTYTIETEDFTLPMPTKAEYIFVGWTGTGLEKKTRKVTIPKGSTGDRTYTANWGVMGPIETTTFHPSNSDAYDYFGYGSADWKTIDNINGSYSWPSDVPCLIFDEEITRGRLGFSQTEYVTYNNQSLAIVTVFTGRKRLCFTDNYGKVLDGYWTLGITQDGIDHEIRFQILEGEFVDFEIIY